MNYLIEIDEFIFDSIAITLIPVYSFYLQVFLCLLAFALVACTSATISSLLGGGQQQQQQQQPKIVKIIHINGGGGGGHGHGHSHGDSGHSVIHLLVPTGDSGHSGWAAPSNDGWQSGGGWQSSGGWQSGGDGWNNGWD